MKRLIAAIVMTSYLTACTSWRLQDAAPQEAAKLRVTLPDGRRLVLRDPRVMGDSLVGFVVPRPESPSQRVRVAVLAADVQRVEGRKLDAGKTVLAGIGLGVVIAVVVALRNFQTTDPYH